MADVFYSTFLNVFFNFIFFQNVFTSMINIFRNRDSRQDTTKLILLVIPERTFSALRRVTRSQAVARIADRTAKNCKGHVT